MDISDLTYCLDYGDTFAKTASFLCRDEMRSARKRDKFGWSSIWASASTIVR
jgi:hypothetical protein